MSETNCAICGLKKGLHERYWKHPFVKGTKKCS